MTETKSQLIERLHSAISHISTRGANPMVQIDGMTVPGTTLYEWLVESDEDELRSRSVESLADEWDNE